MRKLIDKYFGGHPHPLYAAAALFIGVVLIFFSWGMRFMGFCFVAAAAVILFFFALKLAEKRFPRLTQVLKRIAVWGLLAFFALFAVTETAILINARTDAEDGADYLIVLGAQVWGERPSGVLQDRLESTLEYMEENSDTVAIVSGARGSGEDITEAECMARWLTEHGVEPERIWQEPRARRTMENIGFAAELIREKEGTTDGVFIAVVTSEFHVMRGKMIARRWGLDAGGIAASSFNKPVLVSNCVREVFAVWNYIVFD